MKDKCKYMNQGVEMDWHSQWTDNTRHCPKDCKNRFSSIRTFTVGLGFSPSLLTSNRQELRSARGLTR